MQQIWFLLKIIETIFGTVCLVYHSENLSGKEALPHTLLFCGTFFGFTLLSFVGLINIAAGGAPPPLVEFVNNFIATVMYAAASLISMHDAENDFHLMYLSDFEEPMHPFFASCRAQSVAALATAAIHLLHTALAYDVIFSPQSSTVESSNSADSADEDGIVRDYNSPIKMYFLGKYIENKLRKNEWFDNMCTRPSARLTIYSLLPFSSRHTQKTFTDLEKDYSMQVHRQAQYVKRPSSATDKTLGSASSEELTTVDYSKIKTPPGLTPSVSRMSVFDADIKIVDERKDRTESPTREEPLTRFTLPAEGSTAAITPQKPILKKKEKRTKVDEAPLSPKSRLRRSSLEEIHALLKGAPKKEQTSSEKQLTEKKSQVEPSTSGAEKNNEEKPIQKGLTTPMVSWAILGDESIDETKLPKPQRPKTPFPSREPSFKSSESARTSPLVPQKSSMHVALNEPTSKESQSMDQSSIDDAKKEKSPKPRIRTSTFEPSEREVPQSLDESSSDVPTSTSTAENKKQKMTKDSYANVLKRASDDRKPTVSGVPTIPEDSEAKPQETSTVDQKTKDQTDEESSSSQVENEKKTKKVKRKSKRQSPPKS